MADISNKVYAATTGAGLANALSDLLVWWLTSFEHITVPDNIATGFNILFTCLVTFAAGYLTPHANGASPPNS